MPPFFRHPAIPPRPTRVEGEDSREYVEGDITQLSVDAIVNAANVLEEKTTIEQVIFVCFSKQSYNHHQQAVQDMITNKG
jgi:O-acetyl-ADP-ribose deacetylase (regulator of RNase III)